MLLLKEVYAMLGMPMRLESVVFMSIINCLSVALVMSFKRSHSLGFPTHHFILCFLSPS